MTDTDELLEAIGDRIERLKLQAPALFFLELYRPLLGLGQAAALVSAPLIGAALGRRFSEGLRTFLASRENIDALILRLEGAHDRN